MLSAYHTLQIEYCSKCVVAYHRANSRIWVGQNWNVFDFAQFFMSIEFSLIFIFAAGIYRGYFPRRCTANCEQFFNRFEKKALKKVFLILKSSPWNFFTFKVQVCLFARRKHEEPRVEQHESHERRKWGFKVLKKTCSARRTKNLDSLGKHKS